MKNKLNEVYKITRRIKSGDTLTDEERKHYLELTKTVTEFINGVDNNYAADCLTERYINGKSWCTIADELGQMTEDAVRKCCVRAIQRYG